MEPGSIGDYGQFALLIAAVCGLAALALWRLSKEPDADDEARRHGEQGLHDAALGDDPAATTSAPAGMLEPLLGTGEASSFVETADEAWRRGERGGAVQFEASANA